MAGLVIQGLQKRFPNGRTALNDINLTVESGQLCGLVGPSGSGKSTLLRLIAGLETATSGSILLEGRTLDPLPPARRDVALGFQSPVVYPHLTVRQNLNFSAKAAGRTAATIAPDLDELVELLQLGALLDRRSHEISGGERQRVALGRALLRRPRLFLLDEPFANLDAPLRLELREVLASLQRRWGVTTVLVTHDQAEALSICDQIGVLKGGRLLQVGSTLDVYRSPDSWDVAAFLGSPPISRLDFPIDAIREDLSVCFGHGSDTIRLVVPAVVMDWKRAHPDWTEGRLGLRAEQLRLVGTSEDGWDLIVSTTSFQGSGWVVTGRLVAAPAGSEMNFRSDQPLTVGQKARVRPDLQGALWFERSSGRRIPRLFRPGGDFSQVEE